MKILTLNAGSNSLKFEIIEAESGSGSFGSSLVAGAYDNIGKKNSQFRVSAAKRKFQEEKIETRDHGDATNSLLEWIEHGGARENGISSLSDIERIGHRVVHGADRFSGPERITSQVISQIEELEDLAPLHNASALRVIHAAEARVGPRLPMIAVFDTVFHRTIPEEAALYPIPLDLARRYKIRRYGFHGISHRYLMLRYAQITHRSIHDVNLVTLHLEGGSSAAAIQRGKSIDTSMGFTPLEGLMMGTRSGDIDPAIVTYLMRKEGMDGRQIEEFLNKKCGLLGISSCSADTRELREHLSDQAVDLALNMFSYRVRKYVGAYLAALGGAEAVVVGGGIGENTPLIRERIFRDSAWSGAFLDLARNRNAVDREMAISTAESVIQIWVIPTEEGLMMAQDIAGYVEQS